MLLIVSICSIGDPVLDRTQVDTRQGKSQALDATLHVEAKGFLDLLHSVQLIKYRSGVPEKLGGMFGSSLNISRK